MQSVPITFEYNGKTYSGVFETGSGTGTQIGDSWHLMIDRYYMGTFQYNYFLKDWVFNSPKNNFPGMADYFQAYLIGWFQ